MVNSVSRENRKSPCQGCQNRKVGCHIECEEYQRFRDYRDTIASSRAKAYSTRLWGKRYL